MLESVLKRVLRAVFGGGADIDLASLLSRLTESSVATGDATGGSTTTLEDTSTVWEVDKWKDAVVEITHAADEKHYYVTITSNTADTLTFPAIAVTVAAGDHYEIRMTLRLADIDKVGGTTLTGRDISAKGLGFSGVAYENEDTATSDAARRFETSSKKLRDIIIKVSTNNQLFGDSSNQRYPVATGEAIGITQIDISTLYFKNAAAGQNGTVNILAVED